jgi:hypothetical protein
MVLQLKTPFIIVKADKILLKDVFDILFLLSAIILISMMSSSPGNNSRCKMDSEA